MLGRQVSHYRIVELLNEGGMGSVYRAQDLTLPTRHVAIKVVKSRNSEHPDANARFLREAEAASRIDHPNVVTLHEVLPEADANFLIMQYIDGKSLRARMLDPPLSVLEALDVAMQVGSGLQAAHALGVIHRDVKPENVMVTPDGRYKVVDFGLAHLVDRSTFTERGAVVGTIPYIAPEQILGDPVGAGTDLYSLGVMLYEMLARRMPFEADNQAALLYQISNSEPTPLETLRPDLPEDLVRLVSRAMAREPERRHASMTEMLRELATVRARLTEPDPPPVRLSRVWSRFARRHRGLLAAGMAVTVLACALIARRLEPPPTPRLMVIKWENVGPDRDLEWLSTGIMDCLIRALAGHEEFHVINRQTVFSALETIKVQAAGFPRGDALSAAERIGATYLVSGDIQSTGHGARVSCELTDLRKGTVLRGWTREVTNLSAELYPTVEEFAAGIAKEIGRQGTRGADSRNSVAQTLTPSLEALRYYQEALEDAEIHDIPAALDHARSSVALDSTFTDAHLLLAMLTPERLEEEHHLALAMAYRFKASRRTRQLVEARDRFARGDIDAAMKTYEAVLGQDPEDVVARSALARLYRIRRRFSDAVAEYQVLKQLNPFDYSFYPFWAYSYIEIGRSDKALRLLEDWHHDFPGVVAPLYELTKLREILGGYREGLLLCDTLATLSPGADLFVRGHLLADVGRLREAERCFMAIGTTPDRTVPLSWRDPSLAWLAWRRRDFAHGLELIERVRREQPSTYNVWLTGLLAAGAADFALADSCASDIAGRLTPATRDSVAPEAFSDRRYYYHLRGVIALGRHQPDEAVRMFEQTLRYTGRADDEFFRTWLGRALLAAGNPTRAQLELDRGEPINPVDAEAIIERGRAALANGDRTRARNTLVDLEPLWKEADADDPLKIEWLSLNARAAARH